MEAMFLRIVAGVTPADLRSLYALLGCYLERLGDGAVAATAAQARAAAKRLVIACAAQG